VAGVVAARWRFNYVGLTRNRVYKPRAGGNPAAGEIKNKVVAGKEKKKATAAEKKPAKRVKKVNKKGGDGGGGARGRKASYV